MPLPPVVLLADAQRPTSDQDALLSRQVTVHVSVHPALIEALLTAGARRRSAGWFILDRPPPGRCDPLLRALSSVPSTAFSLSRRGTAALSAQSAWETTLQELGAGPRGALAAGPEAGQVEVTLTRRTVHVRIRPTGLVACGTPLRLTTRWRLRVDEAETVLADAAHLTALDVSKGALSALRRMADVSVVAASVAGAPALAAVSEGAVVEHMSTADAVELLAAAHTSRPVACDRRVADVAAISNAPAAPRAGLRSYQARFVGMYAASGGLVCALPPGSGKTVAAAAALAHLSERPPGHHRSVVVAPRSLLVQWQAELVRFHPNAQLLTAPRSAAALRRSLRTLDGRQPAVILIATNDVTTNGPALAAVQIDDLVVDEAVFLRRPSQQTSALWQLRRRAARALPLTGTPQRRSADEVAALISFAVNEPHLFRSAPLSGPGPAVAERVGPLVFGSADADVELPPASHRLHVLPPTAAEAALLGLAATHLRSASAAVAVAAADSTISARELATRRAGLLSSVQLSRSAACDPAAVLAAKVPDPAWSSLASAGVSSKRAWLRGVVADGLPTLVFCDSPDVADALASHLASSGIRAAALSSKVPPTRRAALLRQFPESITVLACTQVAQLGLNLQAARRVVHYDMPHSASELHQREGRARRLGGSSVEVLACALAGSIDHAAATRLFGPAATGQGVFQAG